MVESTAKLREEILALSGVDIMLDEHNFKSTYQIMDELAAKWEDLTDIQQASVTELIAGKRQGNIVSSLMTNFETAREALETSLNSEGSATAEHEKWMESIEASVNEVKAAWQSLSQSFLKSDFLKGLLGGVAALANGLGKLFDTFGTLPTIIGSVTVAMSLFRNKGLITFNKETQSIQLLGNSFQKLGTQYAAVSTKIGKYNSLNANHQMQFCNSMKSSNTAFGRYIAGLNGAKASMGGYVGSLVGAKVATAAMRVATLALNTALTMGISLLVSFAIEGIMSLFNASEKLAEKVDELTSKFKEQHNELAKLKSSYDTSNESSMISKYEKLSRGVDNLGRNVSLTSEEYSEYQNIVNSIAEQIPTLVSGYDAQGNALLSVKGNVEEVIEAYEKLIHVQNQEILANTSDIEEDFENTLDEAWGRDIVGRIATPLDIQVLEDIYNKGLKSKKEITKYIEGVYGNSSYWSVKGIADVMEDAGVEGADYMWGTGESNIEALVNQLETDPGKIKGIVDGYYAQFNEAVEQQKTIAQAKLSEAFDVSGVISGLNYDNINEDLQAVARQTVAGLDFNFFAWLQKSGKTVEQWVTEMLNEFNNISKVDNEKIETGFELQTQFNSGEMLYGEYVKNLKGIERVIDNLHLKSKAKEQLKISLGLDDEGVVDQYKALAKRLTDSKNYDFDISKTEAKELLDGLNFEELPIAVDVITELSDNDVKETIDEVRDAIDRELAIQGLSLDLDIKIEKTKLESLSKAISESFSGSGLSEESISAVEGVFGELNGYDPSRLFERTANGIRLNSEEFRKYNSEYKKTNIAKINKEMSSLGDIYNQTKEELYRLTYGTDEYDDKARDLSAIEDRIKALEQAAAAYEGLASSFQEWQMVESAGSQRDMYESLIKGFENIDDEISRGWLDDGTIEFLRLIKGENISATATTKELKEAYESLDDTIKHTTYSVRDFFTVDEDGNSTNTGVYNFLDAIGQLEEEAFGGKDVVKRDKNGNIIAFDFQIAGGDKAIADALGISEELVQIMVRAADDAGFVVSMDGTYQQLDVLKEKAAEAAKKLKESFKKTNYDFFQDGSEKGVLKDYNEALKIWETFKKNKKKDGTVDMSVEGADEAYTLVSTLQSMVDQLSEPVYMKINASQVEKDMQVPLNKLQQYETLVQTEHQLRLKGTDTSQIEADKEEIINYFDELQENKPEIAAELGIEGLTREEIQAKVEAGEIEIPATIDLQVEMNDTLRDMVNVALYNAGIIDKEELEKRVDVNVYAENVDASDVEKKTEEEVENAGDSKTKTKKSIEIIAKTFGIKDVDGLTSKLKKLDDKTIQAIAQVLGQVNVDKLKLALGTMNDVQVKAIAEAIGKGDVDALKTAIGNLDSNTVQAIAEAFGYNDVNELIGAINNLDPKTVEAVAKALGITDVESLKGAIDNVKGKDVEVNATTSGKSKLTWLKGLIDSIKSKTVIITSWFKTIASGGKKKAAQRTGADPAGNDSEVNGTANVNGTTGKAFKQGSWGTKNSGTALGGELGTEVLVRNGRWFTIGNNGAEFFQYKKGDIIFNHKQTEELFKNGKVTSDGGRAKALVGGTAYAEGNAFSKGIGGIGKVISSAVKKVTDKVKETVKKASETVSKTVIDKAKEKTAKASKPNSTTKTSANTTSGSKGEDGNGGVGKVEGSSAGSDSEKDEFEETFDWVELKISRIERAIDQLDQKANNVYKSWSSRNSALSEEISKVGDEIAIQQSAAQKYLKEANSVGLDESYAKKIREGSLDIEDFEGEGDEALVEKIKEYQEWYEAYLDCVDAAEELREEESKLYEQRFENIQSQYDGILQGYEHTEAMLNEYISQAEAQGHIVSTKYYDALINNEKQNISQLKKEQADLIAERDKAVDSGKIVKGSKAWYDMCAEIDDVTQAIEEGTTAVIEYSNAIRDIDWEKFDLIQERISDITAESEFLIELMSNKDLYDDNGKLTEQGAATLGLHAQNYNTHMYQADEYGSEIAKLDEEIAKDPYNQDLINRRRELVEAQRESILAAEDEKNAIKDLVEEGINLELDALQERIDLYNEELDSMKDLYDYQKNVEEQTKNIASLRKQISSYNGFDDEETRAKVQELKVSLEEAEADLQETEWDRYINQQSQLLDTLYTEYETILNSRLDNIDYLLEQVITGINAAAGEEGAIATALGSGGAIASAIVNAMGENGTIKTILNTEANNVGTTLSTAMNNIWSVGEGNAKSVLTKYGDGFQSQQTTTNATLNSIKTDVNAMVDDIDKDAQKKVTANKTTTSAKKDPTKDGTATKKPTTTTNKTTSSGDGKAKVGDKVKFVSGKYYYDSQGKKPLGSKYQGKQVYITHINTSKWATHPYHISTGKTLGSGDLGWLKLNQLSGYASGKKKISNSEYAWTQENGREYIVRPSDGAILTPVAKGDSVLNANASGNIWSMANNPAEFIKDNLKLDTTNVPNGTNVQNSYIQNFENITFSMPNVHSYNELISEMQRDPKFEKLILAMTVNQIAGKSKLAKNKAIR